MQLVEIAFKGNRKEFFLWEADEPPPLKAPVIVEADRGEDLGHVHTVGELARTRNAKVAHGLGGNNPTQKARRLATEAEARQYAAARMDDEDARKRAIERVRANSLVMKVTDAEWQWDRKKLTLYFTAEKRVDFRTLVRELASMFRTRIELKQIGVRDEAKRLDGYGRCGRQYCSASWLPELRPVNLGVAKDQKLSLNPSQISGACGRLMCCLRYEHEFYVTTRRRFPKEGKAIRTAKGEERVISNDLFRERVTLRGDEGEARTVTLAELREELEALGLPFPTPSGPAPQAKVVHHEDHVADVDDESDATAPAELVAVSEPEEPAVAGAEALAAPAETAEQRERRRGRRRGRRGGRRGRHGPDNPGAGPAPQSPPPTTND
ncbi:MAG TPA: regulatory iron-sulfur-containing complex subunit RicT [Gemmatimonadaceae bacterium]|nr:regulatory iron-sulfur-containing complex subunit RicT [Gemmatimonadaceae bacterium]